MTVVSIASNAQCRDAAEILRDMASQAERGEIVSVCVLYERPDGAIGNWQSGTRSQTRMAGALLDAAIRRLGYAEAGE
jgi:hypothetical protein